MRNTAPHCLKCVQARAFPFERLKAGREPADWQGFVMKQLSTLIMTPDDADRDRIIAAMLLAGISAKGCSTPLELFGLLSEDTYDAVVMDLSELGELGYALVARLRGSPELGIIVIGGNLTLDARLRCLQSGADACVPLPADERELACVLLALARRLPAWQEDEEAVAQRGTDEGWELRDQDWTLVAPGGEELSLSANERQIVRLLLGAAGRAIGRAELASELAVDGPAVRSTGERSIDVIVSRLRRKAELAGLVLPIRTVYGSGYLFANS
ncbi:response regulator transcription factor [Bordetella parapertussis]|uniref:Two-component response regulator n=6 Tax=Bordetella TaxID=517 RepID=K0M9M5_BORPB|nr:MULTISPECIES: winged helix-turn-helix domain-containing protein [Bordetella]AMG86642.2 DNA-binding response regulator [Bordetella bronchiseptica]AUL41369.1 hypothetical protein BTL54_00125 [Bordetella parapertussis]AWP61280.1 DNA-binding response regulator [Bordetella parapertussis]AWP68776.1 DNA-binding response regulator [Bordetella parapertussis]AWP72946.1 DNA-binding response regulator [Bordetella bronchiseptica]